MTKLKTLKDLGKTTILIPDLNKKQPCNHPLIPKEHIQLDELRQEAIKWVKDNLKDSNCEITEIKGREITFKHNHPTGVYTADTEYHHFLQGRIAILIEFFNLTEGDFEEISEVKQNE